MHNLLFHCHFYVCFFSVKINSVLSLKKMGGRAIRSEPQVLIISDVAREILERAGWINYLTRLQQSHETVAIEFL